MEQLEDRVVPTTLSIPASLTAVPGGTVQVPINIDNPNPSGSGGLNAATIAITYDPRIFTASSADVQVGTVTGGWSLAANINAVTGQVGISLSSATSDTSTIGGSLAIITLHVNPNATAGPVPINLDANNAPSGSPVVTLLTAAQGPLTLQPPVTNGPNDAGVDGIVTIGLGLEVTNFTPSATGFTVTFNQSVNPSTVNLYTSKSSPDDVLLTPSQQVSIRGSLLFNADDTAFTFEKTNPITGSGVFDPSNGLLTPGTYSVVLRSYVAGSSGFQDLLGSPLDGSGGGFPGSNYLTTFSVAAPPVAVGIASFARGPSNTDSIAITGLTNGSLFTLAYTNPAANPATATATITFSGNQVILQSNIQNALSNLTNSKGGLANQIGFSGNMPNSAVFVNSDNSSGANVAVVFQSALAQATNQLLVSGTPGVSVASAIVNVANNIASYGIPIALSSGQNVVSGSFTLQYNPSLLNITGVVPSAVVSAIQGANFTLVSNTISDATSATAVLSLSSPTNISTGNSAVILGSVIATIPMSAAGNYGAMQLLHFSSEQLTGIGGPISVTSEDGIQVVAFLGDVTGHGQFDLNDAAQIAAVGAGVANTATQTIPGFSNYPNLDPVIVGDVSLQGTVNSTDAGAMIQELGGTARMTIPWTPLGLTVPPSSNAQLLVTAGPANQNLAAGSSANISLGSFTDAGVNDAPWTVTVNWGDSSAPLTFGTVTQGELSQLHSFALAGTYTVTVTVASSAGGTGTSTMRLVVGNVSPTLTAPPSNQHLNTGVANTVSLGSFSDTGFNDGPWNVTVNWGDSTGNTSFAATSQGTLSQPHSYANAGNYTVTVTVTNAAGGAASSSQQLQVGSLTPTLTPPAISQSLNAGISTNVNLGSFSDPGATDGPWTVTVNWGDSTANTTFNATTQGGLGQGHTYSVAGTYTVAVTVTNVLGVAGSASESLTVVSFIASPIVLLPPLSQTFSSGNYQTVNLGSFTDSGTNDGPWNVTVTWGDGAPNTTFGVSTQGTLSWTHFYVVGGNYSTSVTVTSAVGSSASITTSVLALAPTSTPAVAAPGSQSVVQGVAAKINLGSFSDANNSSPYWIANVNWGDSNVGSYFVTPGSLSLDHAYASPGNYTVTETVTESADNKTGSASFSVAVVPLAGSPTVASAPANQLLSSNVTANVNLGSFSDPGANDGPWTVSVSWGDSAPSTTFTAAIQGGLSQAHAYANAGAYAIAVTVTNAAGASSTAISSVTVPSPTSPADYTSPFIVTPYDKIPNFGAHPTNVSVNSGAWSNPAIWSTGVVPTTGDIVSIEPNTTVTYDVVSTAAVNTVIVQNGGQLVFRTDIGTTLTVVNLLVLQGGVLQIGTQANPVAANVTAQIVFPNQVINTATDPSQYGNGLIGLGTITMCGASRNQAFITIAADAHAGDSTLNLSQPATGWQTGDQLFVPDTRQLSSNVPEWELVTIAGISANGQMLTLSAPLQFDHLGAYDGNGNEVYLPQVADLTRNIKVHSASATGTRGYVMFTYQANVNIQNVAFTGLGRTTVNPYDDTAYDGNGNVTHVGANQQDRSPVQFQFLYGPTVQPVDGYQYTFVGNAVYCPMTPMTIRWGIAINGSDYGLVQDNVLYHWAGAGIVTEQGNESYNVIEDNYVAAISGTGARADARVGVDNNDWGTEGSAYWFRGYNNYVSNNVATDCAGFGFTYYAFGVGTMEVPLGPGADLSAGQYKLVNMNDIPLVGFSGNTVYGETGQGITVWSLGTFGNTPYGDASESIIKNFTVWHVYLKGYFCYETNRLTFDGLDILGDFSLVQNQTGGESVGIDGGDYFMGNTIIKNSSIEGMQTGIVPSTFTLGTYTIENTYLRNYYNITMVPLWTSSYTAYGLPPRTTIINNVTFAPALATNNGWGPQYNIRMLDQVAGNTNFVQIDQVFVYNNNGIAGNNFQVFYALQAGNIVLPQTMFNSDGTPTYLMSPQAGLTNTQLWALYGIAVAGAVPPSNATTENDVFGLVAPI